MRQLVFPDEIRGDESTGEFDSYKWITPHPLSRREPVGRAIGKKVANGLWVWKLLVIGNPFMNWPRDTGTCDPICAPVVRVNKPRRRERDRSVADRVVNRV